LRLISITRSSSPNRYESITTEVQPHKKSGGQLGEPETTTDPSKTDEVTGDRAERGEKKAENMRYGQAISEQGVGGFTTGQSGDATQGGYGQVDDKAEDDASGRKAAGYGGKQDADPEIGA
jgi:hypothetical protein